MEHRTIEKILDYLPVIYNTCDRYGWMGGQGVPVEYPAVTESRIFIELLQSKIGIKNIPDLENVSASLRGEICFLWETELDLESIKYDYLEVRVSGDDQVSYKAKLESLNMEINRAFNISEGLDDDIIEHIMFFKRKQDEQRAIQKSTTSKFNSN